MTVRFRLWLGAMACAAVLVGVLAMLYLLVAPAAAAGGVSVLAGAGAVALLLFAPLAWLLAGLTYAPVREVTKTARSIITTGQLDRRCFYPGPRDDVGDLVVVVNELLVRYDAALGALQRLRAAPPACACPRQDGAPDPADLVLDLPAQPATPSALLAEPAVPAAHPARTAVPDDASGTPARSRRALAGEAEPGAG